MTVEVVPLTEADIPGAIEVIQKAFADDPYFKWVFDPSQTGENTELLPRDIHGLPYLGTPLEEVSEIHGHPIPPEDKLTNSGSIDAAEDRLTASISRAQILQFNKKRNHDSLAVRCLWGINNAVFHVAKETGANGVADASGKQRSDHSRIVGVSCWLPPHAASEPESWYSWYQGWVLSWRQMLNNVRHLGRGGLRSRRYWIWKERQHEAQSAIWDDPRGYYFCNIVAVSPDAQGGGIGRKLFEAVTDMADEEGVKCYLESSRNVPNVQIYEKMGFRMKKEMECRDGDDVCMLYCMVREPNTEK